jgi:hypothetical protein
MPKNIKGSKPVVSNDPGTEKAADAGVNRTENIVQPVKIVSMAINANGIFFGLGDDGKVYRLTDNFNWETLQ